MNEEGVVAEISPRHRPDAWETFDSRAYRNFFNSTRSLSSVNSFMTPATIRAVAPLARLCGRCIRCMPSSFAVTLRLRVVS
jgi:hypothetical protein